MALEKTVTTPQGFQANGAYHRVQHIGFQGKTGLNFSLVSYKNKESQVDFQIQPMAFEYDLEGANPYVQAYQYVKTLPEFAEAIDC
jgi:hypothetical protein